MTARRDPAPAPLLRGGPRTAANPSGAHGRRRTTLTSLLTHLTPRDLWLLDMLAEHTVMTSTQITTLWNTSHRSANRRLLTLHRLGLLDSFRPRLERGTAPEHYLIARTAADLLAARHATTPADRGAWSPELITRTAYSPTLTHDLGTIDFFTALAARSHQQPAAPQLTSWWSEQRCARSWGDLVRPDARGQVTGPNGQATVFFLEYDTGTEPHTRLAAKLDDYAEAAPALAPGPGNRPLVLFTVHSHRREAHLHQRLADHPALDTIDVATTARDLPATGKDQHHPADRVWLRLGHPAVRLPLTELGGATTTPASGAAAAGTGALQHAGPPAPHPLGPGPAGVA